MKLANAEKVRRLEAEVGDWLRTRVGLVGAVTRATDVVAAGMDIEGGLIRLVRAGKENCDVDGRVVLVLLLARVVGAFLTLAG